jgi:hypothetical protein
MLERRTIAEIDAMLGEPDYRSPEYVSYIVKLPTSGGYPLRGMDVLDIWFDEAGRVKSFDVHSE